MQQDVEVGRKEWVQIGEALSAEIGVVILGVLQLGVVSQRLALGIKELPEFRFTRRRFAEQTPVASIWIGKRSFSLNS
jgi:hypothetical protein